MNLHICNGSALPAADDLHRQFQFAILQNTCVLICTTSSNSRDLLQVSGFHTLVLDEAAQVRCTHLSINIHGHSAVSAVHEFIVVLAVFRVGVDPLHHAHEETVEADHSVGGSCTALCVSPI